MRELASIRLPEKPGNDPAVLVLREDEESRQFMTHVRVEPPHEQPFHVWGSYFPYGIVARPDRREALVEAVQDFNNQGRFYKVISGSELVVLPGGGK
jgi:hypothetical protein